MSLNLVKLGVTAGIVLASGGYTLWRYRRQIEKLLSNFIEWVNVKMTHLASYAKEIFQGMVAATKGIVETATESLRRRWTSLTPEQRRQVTGVTNEVITVGITAALGFAQENIRLRFPDNNSQERQVLSDVEGALQRLLTDVNGSITTYLS